MKLYIIAGELSGDSIGGLLIDAISEQVKRKFSDIKTDPQFCGIGGKNMQDRGIKSLFPIEHINLMGLLEVIPHIFKIKKLIDRTIEDIVSQNPDILITIDSPGFTYRVASKIREIAPHIKLVHVVAPSVWAYRPSRAKKYAKVYDHLLTLLPFEPKYFTRYGLPSTFIGHPTLEQRYYARSRVLEQAVRHEIGVRGAKVKVIVVTPGSRKGEITRHMPIIRQALDQLADKHVIRVVFVRSDKGDEKDILQYLDGAKFKFSFSTERLKMFAICDCALSKSGTNTIELAASGSPMIVGYKLNPVTFFLLKLIIKVRYAALVNIIADREIIPEYIQHNFNADNIAASISNLLADREKAQRQVTESQNILRSIGYNSIELPSRIAARVIVDIIK